MRGFAIDCGPCPYLPGRRFTAFHPDPNPPTGIPYRVLLDHRFRRSGPELYAPICEGCAECRPLRVPVAAFRPRPDQRRCARRNADLAVAWRDRGLDGERLDLYRRYELAVHDKAVDGDPSPFLVDDGGIPGGELHVRDAAGRLLAVAICDRADDALSSVYCYWDPAHRRRGLGTFMALAEIAYAAAQGLRWWYPGFLVAGCPKMAYKARYRPCEVLIEGAWRALDEVGSGRWEVGGTKASGQGNTEDSRENTRCADHGGSTPPTCPHTE